MNIGMICLRAFAATAFIALGGCVTATDMAAQTAPQSVSAPQFETDRAAILAMAGNYRVTFDFTETVSFVEGYELKDQKLSAGDEIIRVIEDRGNFISLQHILVVGGDDKFPVKHWRQDWRYEPTSVLVYIGGNAWETRPLSPDEAKGKWSQVVYQVDDSPRYGALSAWEHNDGLAQWAPPREWRPLPRRDATTRDDYHTVDAINRHTITPFGWVHEQDNTKLILTGQPQALVREIAVNTYRQNDDFDIAVGEDYWTATEDYWAGVRAEWTRLETENIRFGLTVQGEPEALYIPLLNLASEIKAGERTTDAAIREAISVIDNFVTTAPGTLNERLKEGK